MLLPQSSAFATLRNRLNSITPIGYLQLFPRPYSPIETPLTPALNRLPARTAALQNPKLRRSIGLTSWLNSAPSNSATRKHALDNRYSQEVRISILRRRLRPSGRRGVRAIHSRIHNPRTNRGGGVCSSWRRTWGISHGGMGKSFNPGNGRRCHKKRKIRVRWEDGVCGAGEKQAVNGDISFFVLSWLLR